MYVTYTPEDSPQDTQSWVFDPDRVRVAEQVIVEQQYGARWSEFVAECMAGQARARRVLLWHLLRRTHPALPWRDTPNFLSTEFEVEQSYSELLANYNAWVAGGGAGGEHGPTIEVMFQERLEAAREREGLSGEDGMGKAPSKNEPAPTSG